MDCWLPVSSSRATAKASVFASWTGCAGNRSQPEQLLRPGAFPLGSGLHGSMAGALRLELNAVCVLRMIMSQPDQVVHLLLLIFVVPLIDTSSPAPWYALVNAVPCTSVRSSMLC